MLIMLALLVAPAEGMGMGDRMRAWCTVNEPSNSACGAEQIAALKRYLRSMVLFEDPGQAVAERCMREGKTGTEVNWRIALACFDKAKPGMKNALDRARKP